MPVQRRLGRLACLPLAVAFVLTASASPARAAGWTLQSTGANNSSLQAISCPSTTICFSAQYGGGLVREDSGGTWSTTTSISTSQNFFGISCWDVSHCVVVGSAGSIYYTGNGGSTWTQETGPNTTATLEGVSCAGSSTVLCLAVGLGGTIWGSTTVANGATATWSSQSNSSTANLYGVSCASTSGCAIGGTGGVWGGTGSGYWVSLTSGVPPSVTYYGLSCFTTSNCTAVGSGGTVITTTNASSWTSEATGTSNTLDAVSCPNANHCVAVGAGGVVIGTIDGVNWLRETGVIAANLTGVSCASSTTCTMVSVWTSGVNTTGQAAGATDGGGWGWSTPSSGVSVSLRAVACPSATTCMAVGDSGTLDTTTNAGLTWTASTIGSTSNNLYSITCASTSMCMAGGTGGIVLTYNGSTWSSKSVSSGTITGLACPSTTICYAVDSGGTISYTGNGGSSWPNGHQTSEPVALSAISCTDTTHCTAVGASTTSAWYTTDGNTWTAANSAVGADLNGVSCPLDTFCMVDGQGGAEATSNGGATFTAGSSGLTGNLLAAACSSGTACELVGAAGSIDVSGDGGNTWTSLVPPTTGNLNAIAGISTTGAIAVGDSGTIVRLVVLGQQQCTSNGQLNFTPPSSVSFGSIAVGTNTHTTVSPSFTVDDETGTGSGWAISATSTQFTTGTYSLPTSATTVTGVNFTPNATGTCSVPRSAVSYPVTLPAASGPPAAVQIAGSLAGSGAGPVTVAPTFSLSVPGNAYAGSYTSTWTVTLASGP